MLTEFNLTFTVEYTSPSSIHHSDLRGAVVIISRVKQRFQMLIKSYLLFWKVEFDVPSVDD